jgi:tRNA modification GTPase
LHTIAAISTPNAVGGIAVIRISGSNAFAVAERIFKPFNNKKISDMEGYTCCYGIAHDNNERIDDCILTAFKAPHSYTGEDVVEISCHGGLFISKKILRTALKNGAENAEAGEFTKRAFMNGKLDLTQAEAVMDVIRADGAAQLQLANYAKGGKLGSEMRIVDRTQKNGKSIVVRVQIFCGGSRIGIVQADIGFILIFNCLCGKRDADTKRNKS